LENVDAVGRRGVPTASQTVDKAQLNLTSLTETHSMAVEMAKSLTLTPMTFTKMILPLMILPKILSHRVLLLR
jgi:hypothetical protein